MKTCRIRIGSTGLGCYGGVEGELLEFNKDFARCLGASLRQMIRSIHGRRHCAAVLWILSMTCVDAQIIIGFHGKYAWIVWYLEQPRSLILCFLSLSIFRQGISQSIVARALAPTNNYGVSVVLSFSPDSNYVLPASVSVVFLYVLPIDSSLAIHT